MLESVSFVLLIPCLFVCVFFAISSYFVLLDSLNFLFGVFFCLILKNIGVKIRPRAPEYKIYTKGTNKIVMLI